MKSRGERIEFDRNYCEHYAPQPWLLKKDYCAIGCGASERMKSARDAGEPNMTPCIRGHLSKNVLSLCPKWERRSLERAEARADSIEKRMRQMEVVFTVIKDWRTWTQNNQVAKQEVIECPVCMGRLHLSQSGYNGHVHGKCETDDCVSWME